MQTKHLTKVMTATILRLPRKEVVATKKQRRVFEDTKPEYNTLKQYFIEGCLENWIEQFTDFCVQTEDRRILNLIFHDLSFSDSSLRAELLNQKIKKYVDDNDVQSLSRLLSEYDFDKRDINYNFKTLPSDECCLVLFDHLYIRREYIEKLFDSKKYDLLKSLIVRGKCRRFELTYRLQEELKNLSDDNFDALLFLLRHGARPYFSLKIDSLNLNARHKQKLREFFEIKKFLHSVLRPEPFKDPDYSVIGYTVPEEQKISNLLFMKLVNDEFVCEYICSEILDKKRILTKDELLSEVNELKRIVENV